MTKLNFKGMCFLLVLATSAAATTGCQEMSGDLPDLKVLGIDRIDGSPADLPWMDEARSDDPNHLVLATKYVVYADENGNPVLNRDQAKQLFAGINQLYVGCNLHFRVEQYIVANPRDAALDYHPSTMGELDTIRYAYEDDSRLLVVNTGDWNSRGGLGADGANAWTMMPGEVPSGAVIEGVVATNAPLVAHELGHYLNLDHVGDSSNMMNPVIYSNSKTVTPGQCQAVRQAALTARSAALRGFGQSST